MADWRTVRQIVSFGGVGMLATVMHISIALGMSELAGWTPIPSNAAGAAAGFIVSFLGNARLTFVGTRPHLASLWRYATISVASFVIASGIMELVIALELHLLIYAILLLLMIPPLSFLLAKHWAYAEAVSDSNGRFHPKKRD